LQFSLQVLGQQTEQRHLQEPILRGYGMVGKMANFLRWFRCRVSWTISLCFAWEGVF
jgi:hypothetical protein